MTTTKIAKDLSGKKVTVFGLGLHGGGVSTVRFLAQAGARVVVTDLKSREQLLPSLEKLTDFDSIEYVLGQHRSEDFTHTDLVIKSPAIPWKNTYVQAARKAGVPVEMDSTLFLRYWKKPIVGVTGTKGKTTVSLLTARLLKLAGYHVAEVGIGQIPYMDAVFNQKKIDVAVAEMSSWRLSGLTESSLHKSPNVGVFTNFMEDHLNYYSNMSEYLEDKKNIFRYQKKDDWMILNHDDALVRNLQREVPGKVMWFGFSRPESTPCVFSTQGVVYYDDGVDPQRLVTTRELGLKGKHNIRNAMAALAAAIAYGADAKTLSGVAHKIEGVPHRLEFVGEVRGVKYYNDTTATIPEAVVSALHSFTQPVVLIAGGAEKGLKYESFAKSVSHRAKDVIFLKGGATQDMRDALRAIIGEAADVFPEAESMEQAVAYAGERSVGGDVVLLSPGAASFGMFEHEFERGEIFRRVVRDLRK